jgi:hypothetical protein
MRSLPLPFHPAASGISISLALSIALAALPTTLVPRMALAQGMLQGCQLIDGTLQCVPGLTADPEQQIKILRRTIGADQALEAAISKERAATVQVLLSGSAVVGALLSATVSVPGGGAPAAEFHWYRLAPDQKSWQLIPGAKGSTYVVLPADVGTQVLVVSVRGSAGSTQRISSAPIGPVTTAAP